MPLSARPEAERLPHMRAAECYRTEESEHFDTGLLACAWLLGQLCMWDAAAMPNVRRQAQVSGDGTIHAAHGDLPDELAGAFAGARRVAWDVETTGLDWARDRVGTCQLFTEEVGVAVVSITDRRPARLITLLESPVPEKVFHHAPFDLRFMVHAWGLRPASVRCTKVASKLLRPDVPNDAHSLQRLVSRYLGISLAKGAVRTSDWSERAVLTRVRSGLRLSHYLPPRQMQGTGGFTETFDASRLSPQKLRSILDEEAGRLGLLPGVRVLQR